MWCDQILGQAQCLIWKVLEKTAHWQTSLHLHPRHLLLAQPCILLHHGGLFGFQDVVCEDPGHGHLNRKLDSPAHGQLQEELAEPELGEVTALLQGFWEARGREPWVTGAAAKDLRAYCFYDFLLLFL